MVPLDCTVLLVDAPVILIFHFHLHFIIFLLEMPGPILLLSNSYNYCVCISTLLLTVQMVPYSASPVFLWAQVSFEDVDRLKAVAQMEHVRIPHFMQDQARYAEQLTKIMAVNQLTDEELKTII